MSVRDRRSHPAARYDLLWLCPYGLFRRAKGMTREVGMICFFCAVHAALIVLGCIYLQKPHQRA
jgi:hypothetical protein